MKKENWNESNIPDQSGKIFIVTGPTSGLGEETTRVLSRKNATVIMAARNIKKAESVANEILAENKNAKIDFTKQPMFFGEDNAVQRFDTFKFIIFN